MEDCCSRRSIPLPFARTRTASHKSQLRPLPAEAKKPALPGSFAYGETLRTHHAKFTIHAAQLDVEAINVGQGLLRADLKFPG